MKSIAQDSYQLAGIDPRERGFSRPVNLVHEDDRYRAFLRYETTRLVTEPADSQETALHLLVGTLHQQGYRQLKTQVSFRNGTYLGSTESWVEYPDPVPVSQPTGLMASIRHWFHRDKPSA